MWGARGREDPECSVLKALSVTPRPRAAAEARLAGQTFHPVSRNWAVTLRSLSLAGGALDTESRQLPGTRRMRGHLLTSLEPAWSPRLSWQ